MDPNRSTDANEERLFPETLTLPQDFMVWITFVPHRKPQIKAHESLARARTAMSCHYPYGPVALYEVRQGACVKVDEGKPPACRRCGSPEAYPLGTPKVPVYKDVHECWDCRQKR